MTVVRLLMVPRTAGASTKRLCVDWWTQCLSHFRLVWVITRDKYNSVKHSTSMPVLPLSTIYNSKGSHIIRYNDMSNLYLNIKFRFGTQMRGRRCGNGRRCSSPAHQDRERGHSETPFLASFCKQRSFSELNVAAYQLILNFYLKNKC